MTEVNDLRYFRARWPDAKVPADSPIWMLYEVDQAADNVLRIVEVFEDGRITRNSIQIEQGNGDHCPSLFDMSVAESFEGVELEAMTQVTFGALWQRGVDRPFWFGR